MLMSDLEKREAIAIRVLECFLRSESMLATSATSAAKEAVEQADALLAELARTEPKQAESDNDGWIAHKPGDPMPCGPDLVVEITFADGEPSVTKMRAIEWDWSTKYQLEAQIIAWRPAR